MRRAAMAVIIGGYAFGGIGSGPGQSGPGHQPVMADASLTADVKPVKAAKPGSQIVKFDGYTVSVPASWPVYNLNKDPRQCVRYDVHAVYLGTPGPDQNCPPRLVGRVETVTIEDPAVQARKKIAGDRKTLVRAGQRALTPGTIVQDPDLHELAIAMPDTAPRIDATYGADPGTAEQMLATVQQAGTQATTQQAMTQQATTQQAGDSIRVTHPVVVEAADLAHATNPAWPKPDRAADRDPPGLDPPDRTPRRAAVHPAVQPAARQARPQPTGPARAAPPARPRRPARSARHRPGRPARHRPAVEPVPASAAVPAVLRPRRLGRRPSAPPSAGPVAVAASPVLAEHGHGRVRHLRGPVTADHEGVAGEARTHRHLYRRPEVACGQSNLSASWVRQADAMGWSFMPTFVGLQAPCDSFSGKINPKQAAAQGTAAANQAIADANSYGWARARRSTTAWKRTSTPRPAAGPRSSPSSTPGPGS